MNARVVVDGFSYILDRMYSVKKEPAKYLIEEFVHTYKTTNVRVKTMNI
jgi:hypothetical protein